MHIPAGSGTKGVALHLYYFDTHSVTGTLADKNSIGEGFLVLLVFQHVFPNQAFTDVVTFINNEIDWANYSCTIGEMTAKNALRLICAGQQHLDRVYASLPGGFVVFVSLRSGRVSGERRILVEITVKPKTPKNGTQA